MSGVDLVMWRTPGIARDPSMSTVPALATARPEPEPAESPLSWLGPAIGNALVGLGDWVFFSIRAISGTLSRHIKAREFLRICAEVGSASVGVIAITGLFIGMVLAVQTYAQLHMLGLDTSLGAIIHMSLVRELGPVLAAVMLAGRVGTAMAAQLATMRVTEQIDALACLGVDPVKYLVAPRFLGCILMIPLLTVLAIVMGILGSTLICLEVYQIDSYHYWRHTTNFVRLWDLFVGIGKSVVFGGVLALICCHRGFNSRPGAVGVGRAATEGFVLSFVAIIAIDFILAMFTNTLSALVWPPAAARMV
jgi:phospholipid/cholesterol/gamma-HCH transport system permease protein